VAIDVATTVAIAIGAPEPARSGAAITLGAISLLLLAVGLVARTALLVAPAAAMLGAAYATTLSGDVASDLDAPLVAVALLLMCELAYRAHEVQTTSPDEPGAHARHLAWLGVLGLAALLPGVALLALADLLRVGGIPAEAVGVVAIAVLVGGLLWLARGVRSDAAHVRGPDRSGPYESDTVER
jgi:hypothetical protein